MTIRGYGIELVRLEAHHIEMLRQWRNDESINRFMDYREHISQEAQERWFRSLDTASDFFFLIRAEGEFHGLIHFSAIDWAERNGQSGLFIRTKDYQGTPLPVCASVLMLEYFFTHTPLEAIEAKVMNDNALALSYNMSLGFWTISSESPDRFQRLRLNKEDFYRSFSRQLDLLRRVHGHSIAVEDRTEG